MVIRGRVIEIILKFWFDLGFFYFLCGWLINLYYGFFWWILGMVDIIF